MESSSKKVTSSMSNWRGHRLIKCSKCLRLMGHHKPAAVAVCVECKLSTK